MPHVVRPVWGNEHISILCKLLQIFQEGVVSNICQVIYIYPKDYMQPSPSGFSAHGILQARILSGQPFPSPADLPDPGNKPESLTLQADCFLSEPPEKPPHMSRALKTPIFFDAAVLLLGIYPREIIQDVDWNLYTIISMHGHMTEGP